MLERRIVYQCFGLNEENERERSRGKKRRTILKDFVKVALGEKDRVWTEMPDLQACHEFWDNQAFFILLFQHLDEHNVGRKTTIETKRREKEKKETLTVIVLQAGERQ